MDSLTLFRKLGSSFSGSYYELASEIHKVIMDQFESVSAYQRLKKSDYNAWLTIMNRTFSQKSFADFLEQYRGLLVLRNHYVIKNGYHSFEQLLNDFQRKECCNTVSCVIEEWINDSLKGMLWNENIYLKEHRTLDFNEMNPLYPSDVNMDFSNLEIVIDRYPKFYSYKGVNEIRVSNQDDYCSISHELGHYCFCTFLKMKNKSNTLALCCNELIAVLFEIYNYYVAGNAIDDIKRKYSHTLGWISSLADYEKELGKSLEPNGIHFVEYLKRFFSDIDNCPYYDNMWISQGHLMVAPGYLYSYKIALATAIRILNTCTNIDDLRKRIMQIFNDVQCDEDSDFLTLIWKHVTNSDCSNNLGDF